MHSSPLCDILIACKKSKKGKIIIPATANPWPHELRVAKILAQQGNTVEFIPEGKLKSADIRINGSIYEIKSPKTSNHKKIIRNVKRALEKSQQVIIDSSRIRNASDTEIYRLLRNKAKDLKTLKRLIFITKRDKIIDIL